MCTRIFWSTGKKVYWSTRVLEKILNLLFGILSTNTLKYVSKFSQSEFWIRMYTKYKHTPSHSRTPPQSPSGSAEILWSSASVWEKNPLRGWHSLFERSLRPAVCEPYADDSIAWQGKCPARYVTWITPPSAASCVWGKFRPI